MDMDMDIDMTGHVQAYILIDFFVLWQPFHDTSSNVYVENSTSAVHVHNVKSYSIIGICYVQISGKIAHCSRNTGN